MGALHFLSDANKRMLGQVVEINLGLVLSQTSQHLVYLWWSVGEEDTFRITSENAEIVIVQGYNWMTIPVMRQ